MLLQMVYISEAKAGLTRQDMDEIVRKSVINNAEIGVTGLLVQRHNQFMQVLEGSEPAVEILFRHIQADDRHSRLMTISKKMIVERDFPAWSMGWSDLPAKTDEMTQAFDRVSKSSIAVLENIESDVRYLLDGFRKGLWEMR